MARHEREGEPADDAHRGRRPGRPPRINRELILAAARRLPPRALTMQAVADALGVDRKALHRYVGDKDGLLELVVADLFDAELKRIEVPSGIRWQELLAVYATAIRDGIVRSGSVQTHYRLSGPGGPASLALAERVLHALVEAGFDLGDAGGILTFVGDIAFSAARNAIVSGDIREHPQVPEVTGALNDLPATQFPLLREVTGTRRNRTPERDFDLDLRILIGGLEALLAAAD
ncbi:TetR/AcrR family transcriptional regulator C-terminal domain-containing protein [Mycolicibacterium septicum]|nr:TetR/AcrR family transcriptional regulator C-terminal domain-containing protein [Mycolicibacterium septicum]